MSDFSKVFSEKMWKKIEEELLKGSSTTANDSSLNFDSMMADALRWGTGYSKRENWAEGVYVDPEDVLKAGPTFKKARPQKTFSPQTHTTAKLPYFHDWVATRLGVPRDVAKSLVMQRLYGTPPDEIARIIAANTSLPEIKSACEAYLN